ncbi:hypothetical protein [Rossellomorea marisflavi]|uniref:hypothetical protein n=1 Tax=Rossellomorea marisflavi TaxID=189381 RepID=UPI003F9FF7DF
MIYPHIAVSTNKTVTVFNDSDLMLRVYVSTQKGARGTVMKESAEKEFTIEGLELNTLYFITAYVIKEGQEIDRSKVYERVLMEPINWSPTANIPNWLFFDGNRIYGTRAGGLASRLVYSDNYGNTWNLIKDFGFQIQGFFKDSRGYMYVSCTVNKCVYKSTDQGITWNEWLTFTHQGAEAYQWSFAEDYQGNLYIGQYGNVRPEGNPSAWVSIAYLWKSKNGESIERIDYFVDKTDKHIHKVFVDKYTNFLYVTIGDGNKYVYYSMDQGATWKRIGEEGVKTGYTGLTSHKGAVFGCDDVEPEKNNIWKTNDLIKWEKSYAIPLKFNMQMYSIMSFEDGEIWATCHNEWQLTDKKSALVRSTDGGVTWEVYAITPGIPAYLSFSYVGYDKWGKSNLPYVYSNGGTGLIRIPRLYKVKDGRARKF